MMLAIYPALYRDRWGEEKTTIENDGKRLRMMLRGVEFTGRSPTSLVPSLDPAAPQLESFDLRRCSDRLVELVGYALEYEVSIPLVVDDRLTEGLLTVHAEIDEAGELGPFWLELTYAGTVYRGIGTSGWFEHELVEIQAALPADVYMKACINCAYSDYNVYGHSIFGDMRCFRDNKEAYLAAQNKREFMQIMDTYTEEVQETYLCPEFQRRQSGTGYRG